MAGSTGISDQALWPAWPDRGHCCTPPLARVRFLPWPCVREAPMTFADIRDKLEQISQVWRAETANEQKVDLVDLERSPRST